MKILLLEPVLAHYRKDLYQNYFDCEEMDFDIVGGADYQGIKSLKGDRYILLNYWGVKIFGQYFYYLRKSLKYISSSEPDIIICSGVDFHLIHTLLIYFINYFFKNREFYWWSHASKGKQGRIGEIIRKFFYKRSSGIFVYSESGYEVLVKLGIPSNKVIIIGNAINKIDYGFLNFDISQKKTKSQKLTLLFCGRVTKEKKLEVFIEAINYLMTKYNYKIECLIVGGGVVLQYQELIEKYELTDVIKFVGAKYGEELHSYYLDSDLFIYPGGIGLSLLQAFSFGLPVITTDNMQLHGPEIELLSQKKNGEFFKDNSYKDLADKIVIWKDKIGKSKESICKKCIDAIEEKGYMPDMVSEKVLNYFKDKYLNN